MKKSKGPLVAMATVVSCFISHFPTQYWLIFSFLAVITKHFKTYKTLGLKWISQAKHVRMSRTSLFIQLPILLRVDQPHKAVYHPYKATVVYI